MDDKTFQKLIKKGELSLILMDGGVDLTPSQMRKVKAVAKELSDKKLQDMAFELASSPGYKEMMLTPIMARLMKQTFQDKQQPETPTTDQESVQANTPEPKAEKKETAPRPEPKHTSVSSTPIQNVEEGDSELDILNKMFNFMKDDYDFKNEKHKKDTTYKKKLKEDEERRSGELLGLFTGKKTKGIKKGKKEEIKKPTAEKVPSKEPSKPSTFTKVATTAAAAATGAAVVGGALTLGNLIAQKGESGKAGYNAANMGTKNNKIVAAKKQESLQDMTIGEVMSRQSIKWGASNEDQKLFAVGKYQMIPDTLSDAVSFMNISKDEKFTPQLQERMFSEYLISKKRPDIAKYLNSPVDDPTLLQNAVRAISREWASVADPDKGGQTSYYGSGNKALISVDEISSVLKKEREDNIKKISVPQQALTPTLNKPEIPQKLKPESGKKPSGVSVSNVNTNVYNGGTSYNVVQAEQNNNPALIDKQYN